MLTRRLALGAGFAALASPVLGAAPMRGGQVAGWYRFRLGGFECTVVSDGQIDLAPPHPTFGGNIATAAEITDALEAAFLPMDRLPTAVNCLVVNTGRQLVLLDAGVGPAPVFGPGTGRIAEALVAAGIQPAEIDLVAFTHAHADHLWGIAGPGGADVFPNARFAMTDADIAFWTSDANLSLPEPIRALVAGSREVVLPRRAKFATQPQDGELVPGIRSVFTPGHTLGHVSYHLESEGQRLLVMGDVANHPVLALMRPDWPFGFDSDPALASATRRRVLDMVATEKVQVLGYHFPWPGLGHVEKRGTGFGFTPSAWQWG